MTIHECPKCGAQMNHEEPEPDVGIEGAMGRHLTGEAIDGPTDPATGLAHAAQVAWNALARLELMLRASEDK